jgi:hypothetical protein
MAHKTGIEVGSHQTMQLKEEINNSIKLHPLSGDKNSMFNLVAIFGVIGSSTTPRSISENCDSLRWRGAGVEDRVIFGKTNA